MIARVFALTAIVATLLGLTISPVASAAEPQATRITAGLQSAEQLLSDLEFAVAKLAEKPDVFENLIFPNIDIFLIGVDPTKPVGLDTVLDADAGQRQILLAPVADLDDFLDDNLDPIDVICKRVRSDRTLYEVSGSVIEAGWMRYVDDYAVFSATKDDVPKSLSDPIAAHRKLLGDSFLLGIELQSSSENIEPRTAGFQKFRTNVMDGLEKFPKESKEQFELRQVWMDNQLETLQEWFVETALIQVGMSVDQKSAVGTAKLRFEALPETNLSKSIEILAEHGNRFAGIPRGEKSLLSIRANYPLDERQTKSLREEYELLGPVIEQFIREEEKTDDEIAARVELSQHFLDVLKASAALPNANGFLELQQTGETHTIVLGIGCADEEKVTRIIELLPKAKEGWTVEMNALEADGVKVHKLSLGGKVPPSLRNFYGSSGIIHLGVGKNAFWAAAGSDAEAQLKKAIAETTSAAEAETDNVMFTLFMDTRPVLKNIYEFTQEENLSFLEKLQNRQAAREAAKKENGEENERRRAGGAAGAIGDMEWEKTMIAALEGYDGTLLLELKRTENGKLNGHGEVHKGLIRAFGAVVAQFAEENLQ